MLKTPQWIGACKLLNKDLNRGSLAPWPAPSLPCLETHLHSAWPYGRDQRRASTIPGNGTAEVSWRMEAGSESQGLRHRDVTTSERCHSILRWNSSGKINMLLGREGTEIVAQSLIWRVWELCHVIEVSVRDFKFYSTFWSLAKAQSNVDQVPVITKYCRRQVGAGFNGIVCFCKATS